MTTPPATQSATLNSAQASSSSGTRKSTLFTRNGDPIKFFIQADTGKNFKTWLSNTILKHGGDVTEKIPVSGYVLIDPDTDSGNRLFEKWTKPDRPDRHVVSYTFVRASITAKRLMIIQEMKGVSVVFADLGVPVSIWLHPSLGEEVISSTAVSIEKHGGVTDTTEEKARVIIAPHTTKKEIVLWNDLIKRHDNNEAKYIEDVDWVNRCIEQGKFEKTSHRKRNLGGRKPGAKRVEYTEQDDKNLVQYIAEKIPYLETGGRLGNNLYMDLENSVDQYPWASRHSWHSWRNRYKSRQLIFDVAIRDYVQAHPPPDHDDGDDSRRIHPQMIPVAVTPAPQVASNDSAKAIENKGKEKQTSRKPPIKGKTASKKRTRAAVSSESESAASLPEDDVEGVSSSDKEVEDGAPSNKRTGKRRRSGPRQEPARKKTKVAVDESVSDSE